MSNSQKSVVESSSDVLNINPNNSRKCCSIIKIILINVLTFVFLGFVGWYVLVRSHIDTLENQVINTMNAVHNVVPASEVRALQQSVDALVIKINELEQRLEQTQEIRLQVQAIESKLKEMNQDKHQGSSDEKVNQLWRNALVEAINNGSPLAQLRQNKDIPEKVREHMMGVDFIPTYKNISEAWSALRSTIKFKEKSIKATETVSLGWWDSFKLFLRSIFKVQRLNKDNLTPEEVLIRDVDQLLIEKDINTLMQQLSLHMDRFDTATERLVKEWIKKLELYHKGQQIINMVKA